MLFIPPGHGSGRSTGAMRGRRQVQVRALHHRIPRQQFRALDRVAQFAHIARPIVGQQRGNRFIAEAQRRAQEIFGQRQDVLGPLGQRRQGDLDDVQAIEQILAETPFADQRRQVRIGGADDARAGLARAAGAELLELAGLEHAQQLDLSGQRQIADLIEEQRAAVGGLEAADARAVRPGVGTGLGTEQLGLDQFDAQFSSFNLSGNVGSAQRFSYVLSYNVAGVIGPEHGQYGYDVQPDPNNPGYGLAVFGSPLNDDVNQRSELAKFRYRLSESTSITAAFIGFQGEQNPQGVAYGSYVGPTTIESSISTPNTGAPPTVNYNAPGLQDLVGRTVPGYVWYPGTYTSTSQPFFEAELRSAIGKNDTLLVRPYAAVITRFVDGNEEASFPGAWTQGPASAYVEQYQSAYDEIESERLHGATLTYLHPYGEDNVVNFSYDYHSLFSSDYYGYPQLQINVAPTTARTSDFSLSTLLTIAPKVKLALGDYETSWNLDYLAGASASSLASFTRTVAHNDPHLGLNWRPNPKFALRFSAGSGITVPYADQVSGLPSVSNGNSGVNTLETVNPNLKPEVTVAYDLGTDIELPGRNKLSFDVYDDTIHDTFVASTYAVPPSYLAGFPNPYQIVSTWLNGPAQRDDGIELALGSGRRFGLGYDANVTFQRAYYDLLPQSFYALAASTAINGAQIDGIPFTTAHGEVNWTGHEGNLRAAFGADYVGQNNWTNGGGFVTFYSALRRDVGHLGTLQVSVSNLFNKGTGAPYGFGVYNGGFARPEYGPDAAGTGLGYSAVPQFLQSIPPLTIRFSLAKQVGW